MFASKDLFQTLPSGAAYQISRSVRLRSSASAYFNRTPASASNRKTWTWSGWVKRGSLSATQVVFGALQTGTTGLGFGFQSTNTFFYSISGVGNFETTALYRDPSAWYHIVFALDSTQATQANRAIVYINGVNVAFATNGIVLNNNYDINNTVAQYIGQSGVSSQYLDGYLTEINFIDGQALTPSSFGSTNAATGVWQPIKYTGTYGTNGFYMNFSDNSSNTATTIGKDYSGNGNNWTPNNISVTTGVTYDSMLDVPTLYADGGNGRGNYPVMNPLVVTSYTYAYGNLALTNSVANWFNTRATIPFGSTGKFYYEQVCTAGANCWAGIGNENTLLSGNPAGNDANSYGYGNNGNKYFNSVATAYGSTFTTNDVIGVAFDAATGSVWFAKNGTWQNSGVPASGTGYAFTGITGTMFPIGSSSGSGAAVAQVYNFGQSPFTYTPPTGFVALNTQNLSTPTISNGAAYMAATLWTGTNATLAIDNSVNGTSMQPDFMWIKRRSSVATSHVLIDSVRGITKVLWSDLTASESTPTAGTGITAINSNGFTLGTDISTSGSTNTNAQTFVGWQWKAGAGSSSSNTSGSITSTVSVNATAGFSVVTYTGTGANATVGHGLGVAPKMVITKNRGATSDWAVWHTSLTSGAYYLLLDTTAAQASGATYWNSTVPTSSVFSVGTATPTNVSTNTYVAYCFAAVAGYSAFGSYTGNASTDGPFVYLGFRPRFIMIKRTDSAGDWYIYDSSRGTYNEDKAYLVPDGADAENSSLAGHDLVSNGFKVRTSIAAQNASGGTFIYAAFAENPFKYSLAR